MCPSIHTLIMLLEQTIGIVTPWLVNMSESCFYVWFILIMLVSAYLVSVVSYFITAIV
jgi:hypothetical protein